MRISFWRRVLDTIAPRLCVVCGRRLTITEQVICAVCNLHLPRTDYGRRAEDNDMARLFWGRIPISRAAAFFFFEPHTDSANLVYEMKYHDHPEIGPIIGRMMASELHDQGFFEGIDAIVPIPLAQKRYRMRGYNQSEELARGVSELTGLPVLSGEQVVRRKTFDASQTRKKRWDRNDNVEDVFELTHPEKVKGKHLLLIDDVVTTGATVSACGAELAKAGDVTLSVLALGFTKS